MASSQTSSSQATDPNAKIQPLEENLQEILTKLTAQNDEIRAALTLHYKSNLKVTTDSEKVTPASRFYDAMSLITEWFQGLPRQGDPAKPTARDRQWLLAIAYALEPTAQKDGLDLKDKQLGFEAMKPDIDAAVQKLFDDRTRERQAERARAFQAQARGSGAGL